MTGVHQGSLMTGNIVQIVMQVNLHRVDKTLVAKCALMDPAAPPVQALANTALLENQTTSQ